MAETFGILFATPQEAGPFRACLSAFRPSPSGSVAASSSPSGSSGDFPPVSGASADLDVFAEARVGSHRVLCIISGIGPEPARRTAAAVVDQWNATWLVSAGISAGLREDLPLAGMILAAEVVDDAGRRWKSAPFPGRSPGDLPFTPVEYGSSHLLLSPADKHAARVRTGADAADMESAAVAEVAACAGIPFTCLRAVSDTVNNPLPLDFSAFLDARGQVLVAPLVLHLLLHPRRIPGVVQLGWRTRQASLRLAQVLLALLQNLDGAVHADEIVSGTRGE